MTHFRKDFMTRIRLSGILALVLPLASIAQEVPAPAPAPVVLTLTRGGQELLRIDDLPAETWDRLSDLYLLRTGIQQVSGTAPQVLRQELAAIGSQVHQQAQTILSAYELQTGSVPAADLRTRLEAAAAHEAKRRAAQRAAEEARQAARLAERERQLQALEASVAEAQARAAAEREALAAAGAAK